MHHRTVINTNLWLDRLLSCLVFAAGTLDVGFIYLYRFIYKEYDVA